MNMFESVLIRFIYLKKHNFVKVLEMYTLAVKVKFVMFLLVLTIVWLVQSSYLMCPTEQCQS